MATSPLLPAHPARPAGPVLPARPAGLALLALLALLAAPARAARVSPARLQAASQLRVELDVHATTERPGPSGAAAARVEETAWSAALLLELRWVRRFRDGSTGYLVRILEGARRAGEGGAPPEPPGSWPLIGRSFELRAFDDGEILSLGPAGELLAEDRLPGLVDLLAVLLSPQLPELRRGEEVERVRTWAILPSPGAGLRQRFVGRYAAQPRGPGARGEKGPPAWTFTWAGSSEGQIRGLPEAEGGRAELRGSLGGRVVVEGLARLPVPLRIVEHQIDAHRTVRIPLAGGAGSVVQEQRVAMRSERVAVGPPAADPLTVGWLPDELDPVQRDARALRRYPDEADAQAAVAAWIEAASGCAGALPEGAIPFRLAVRDDGRAELVGTVGAGTVEAGPVELGPGARDCLEGAARSLALRRTDAPSWEVAGSLLSRQGGLSMGPGIGLVPQVLREPFLVGSWPDEAGLLGVGDPPGDEAPPRPLPPPG